MTSPPQDPRWPRVLSQSVHDFRGPVSVVAGSVRLLLQERAGPLTDAQRRLLEGADRSCTHLAALLTEMSDLSNLEAGTAPFNRGRLDLRALLLNATTSLPAAGEDDVAITLSSDSVEAFVNGDAVRLHQALVAVFVAVRRELTTGNQLVVRLRSGGAAGRGSVRLAVAAPDALDALEATPDGELQAFDEWRGGCGLGLLVARRVLEAHGGSVGCPAGAKAAAIIVLPRL